jgi:hypothetical protein
MNDGDVLTAEQIADNDVASMKEKRDWWKVRALESADRCAWWEEREDALQRHISINNDLRKSAQVECAALRDRLARAEERERALRAAVLAYEALDDHCETCQECLDYDTCEEMLRLHCEAVAARRAALRATPTDGAAPPRRDEEGDATEGVSE